MAPPPPPGPQVRFGIVGSGWRSAFFLRIAAALPERFAVTGLVTRSAETGRAATRDWGVRTFRTTAELLAAETPSFVVVSVPQMAAPDVIADLVDRGVAVLTETPPGDTIADLERLDALVRQGARIQVAEQYPLSPLLAAQLAIASSGRLGRISQASVAQCHDYHGVRVMRRALGIGFEDAVVTAARFSSPLVAGPGREGDPVREEIVTAVQTAARFDFGDRDDAHVGRSRARRDRSGRQSRGQVPPGAAARQRVDLDQPLRPRSPVRRRDRDRRMPHGHARARIRRPEHLIARRSRAGPLPLSADAPGRAHGRAGAEHASGVGGMTRRPGRRRPGRRRPARAHGAGAPPATAP